jgi:hypothetical protein
VNIYEVAEKHKISLNKLRAMDKDGLLRLDESANASDPIRATLMKGNPLPVSQLVQLVEEPSLLLDLGKYARDAEKQIAALSDPLRQVAPKPVAAAVTDAAKNDPEAVALLVAWLKEIIPTRPVGHAFIAVRLLLGIPPAIRKYEAPRIGRALLNCRNNPALAGWWTVKPGVQSNSTIYQKLVLDL